MKKALNLVLDRHSEELLSCEDEECVRRVVDKIKKEVKELLPLSIVEKYEPVIGVTEEDGKVIAGYREKQELDEIEINIKLGGR